MFVIGRKPGRELEGRVGRGGKLTHPAMIGEKRCFTVKKIGITADTDDEHVCPDLVPVLVNDECHP